MNLIRSDDGFCHSLGTMQFIQVRRKRFIFVLQVLGWALLFLAMVYRSVYTLYEEWSKVLSVLADGDRSIAFKNRCCVKKTIFIVN